MVNINTMTDKERIELLNQLNGWKVNNKLEVRKELLNSLKGQIDIEQKELDTLLKGRVEELRVSLQNKKKKVYVLNREIKGLVS